MGSAGSDSGSLGNVQTGATFPKGILALTRLTHTLIALISRGKTVVGQEGLLSTTTCDWSVVVASPKERAVCLTQGERDRVLTPEVTLLSSSPQPHWLQGTAGPTQVHKAE